MITVYKYPFEFAEELEFQIPKGAELLTVQMQGDRPALWARVDEDAPLERRRISIRATGQPAGAMGRYIATFQMLAGTLVFHAFEPERT